MKLKTTLPFILIFIFFQGASYGNWFDAMQKGQEFGQSQDDRKLQLLNNAEDRRRRIASENEAAAYQRKMRELELEISRLKLQQTQQNSVNIDSLNNALSQGNSASQLKLAFRFYESQNYEEAVNLWRKLAEQGYADAQVNLGFMYANGKGVLKDMSMAKYWTERAIIQGDEQAQTNWDALELWKY